MGKKILLFVIPFFLLFIVGCGVKDNALPLPSSAKAISSNTIELPFPYGESINGENWILDRNHSGDLVLKVKNKGRDVTEFPLTNKNGPFFVEKLGKQYVGGYKYKAKGTIQLGTKIYTVLEVDLNTDNQSGTIVLKSK